MTNRLPSFLRGELRVKANGNEIDPGGTTVAFVTARPRERKGDERAGNMPVGATLFKLFKLQDVRLEEKEKVSVGRKDRPRPGHPTPRATDNTGLF